MMDVIYGVSIVFVVIGFFLKFGIWFAKLDLYEFDSMGEMFLYWIPFYPTYKKIKERFYD